MNKPFTYGMQVIMENAMNKVHTPWSPFKAYCWYNDPWVNAAINYGVKRGWLWRISTTQAGYCDDLFERHSSGRYYFKPGAFA